MKRNSFCCHVLCQSTVGHFSSIIHEYIVLHLFEILGLQVNEVGNISAPGGKREGYSVFPRTISSASAGRRSPSLCDIPPDMLLYAVQALDFHSPHSKALGGA